MTTATTLFKTMTLVSTALALLVLPQPIAADFVAASQALLGRLLARPRGGTPRRPRPRRSAVQPLVDPVVLVDDSQVGARLGVRYPLRELVRIGPARSAGRRVGNECRSPLSPDSLTKKYI